MPRNGDYKGLSPDLGKISNTFSISKIAFVERAKTIVSMSLDNDSLDKIQFARKSIREIDLHKNMFVFTKLTFSRIACI